VSNEVDELFAEESRGVKPRVGLVFVLTLVGLLVAVTGFPCSAVPGGVIVLLAWFFAEKEYARLQTGFFGSDRRSEIVGARAAAIGGVVITALIFSLQLVLTWMGVYEQWWPGIVVLLGWLVWGPLG